MTIGVKIFLKMKTMKKHLTFFSGTEMLQYDDEEMGGLGGYALVHYDDLVALGTMGKGRETGKLRIEGKEYVMKDGDVVEFRFNV